MAAGRRVMWCGTLHVHAFTSSGASSPAAAAAAAAPAGALAGAAHAAAAPADALHRQLLEFETTDLHPCVVCIVFPGTIVRAPPSKIH